MDPGFEALLEYLQQTRGFDFRVYKPAALIRRFEKRLEAVKLPRFEEYRDYLEVHPEEFVNLFNAILINVTSFFRDAESWTYLRGEVLPELLRNKGTDDPIRVWTAGCASGEETYTVAMLLAEALDIDPFLKRVKIYASDVDEEALAQARSGTYDGQSVSAVPPELRAKYFEKQHDRWTFRSDLRRSIIFGRHNVVLDAPISRLDLLICRNTLMYFNAEAQTQILNRFHFALNQNGYLFLGRAEMLVTHGRLFSPVNLGHRIFTRSGSIPPREAGPFLPPALTAMPREESSARLRDTSLENASSAVLVVDGRGILELANLGARSLFGLTAEDKGRPFSDLILPQLPVDLRPMILSAYAGGHPVSISGVELRRGDDSRFLRITIQPTREDDGQRGGVIISFDDLSALHRLQAELVKVQSQLEAANQELQSRSGDLQTTNEELQSANEELQTVNEELQSTNEELQTINDELRQRTDEANRATGFLQAVFGAFSSGVIVVDPQQKVLVWTSQAEDLWGLRRDEVLGQSLLSLDIGLPMDQLRAVLRGVLDGAEEPQHLMVKAHNRRGKSINCRITVSLLAGDGRSQQGAIIVTEEWNGVSTDGAGDLPPQLAGGGGGSPPPDGSKR